MNHEPEYYLALSATKSGICDWCEEHADELWDVRGGHWRTGYSVHDRVCEPCGESIIESKTEQDARDERISRAEALDLRERLERDRQLMERGR